MLSTRSLGPVIIITSDAAAGNRALRDPLEARGAEVEAAANGTLRAALDRLAERQVESLLLEGGAALHAAAWDEDVVDFVRLYVTPTVLGSSGVPFLPERAFASSTLIDRRVEPLGPDVLVEGYVHGPR